jgi:signal transduction histidine kinase
VSIQIDGELEGHRLEPTHEMTLFRLVQEALANVHRHAGSKTVSVAIQMQGGRIRATIADAGRGIPPLTLKEIARGTGRLVGVGILGMKERVRQIGGKLEIQSDRNGTVVTAEFPAEYSQVEAAGLLDQEFSSGSSHLSS